MNGVPAALAATSSRAVLRRARDLSILADLHERGRVLPGGVLADDAVIAEHLAQDARAYASTLLDEASDRRRAEDALVLVSA